MRMLVLGHGKTGKLIAEVAHERGHGRFTYWTRRRTRAARLSLRPSSRALTW